jgi:hypothetical protein
MAQRKKRPQEPPTGGRWATSASRIPISPLNIANARLFAEAAKADAADKVDAAEAAAAAAPPDAPKPNDPAAAAVAALWKELQRMQTERAATPPPAPAPSAEEIAERVRAGVVAALPKLIEKAVAGMGQRPPGRDPPAGQVRGWVKDELNGLVGGLTAVPPPPLLDDNQALADHLFVRAAYAGRLFGVTPGDFFTAVALEIRDFVFRIADDPAAVIPPPTSHGMKSTLQDRKTKSDVLGTAATSMQPGVPTPHTGTARPASPPIEITATGPPLTPALAFRHPSEVAEFAKAYGRTERGDRDVAAYDRLRRFAGRTEEQIAELTNEPPGRIDSLLTSFLEHLEAKI